MAQQVKELATQSVNLSSIPETHVVEGRRHGIHKRIGCGVLRGVREGILRLILSEYVVFKWKITKEHVIFKKSNRAERVGWQ